MAQMSRCFNGDLIFAFSGHGHLIPHHRQSIYGTFTDKNSHICLFLPLVSFRESAPDAPKELVMIYGIKFA
jgi:hypothetical protein